MDTPPRDVGVCSNKAIRSIRTLFPDTIVDDINHRVRDSAIERLADDRPPCQKVRSFMSSRT